MNMLLRPKESLHVSIYSIRKCIGFSNSRDFHLTHCTYLRKVSSGRRKAVEVQEYESNPSVAEKFSVSVAPKKVNDNFFGIESDEGVIKIDNKPSLKSIATRQFLEKAEKEKFITASFGTVRYDSENKPKYHGQLEKEKVLINSIVEKNKIRDLSQTLLNKSPLHSHSVLSRTEKSSKKVADRLDRNLESKLHSSSYVDELYFPESYTKEENNNVSRLESSSTSINNDKVNFIEESYFNNKPTPEPIFKSTDISLENISSTVNCSPPVHEKSTDFISNHKSTNFQAMSGLESLPSSSIDDKSNSIDECYFSDEIANDSILQNVNVSSKSIDTTDKNNPTLAHEKSTEGIADDKHSSIFDDYYFNTVSDDNLKNIDKKNLDSVARIVDTIEKKYNQENSTLPFTVEKNEVFEKNLLNNEPEIGKTDFQVTSKDTSFKTKNLFDAQETETNTKTSYNLNENIEEINADDNGEQLSLQLNSPSLEELEGYNRFLPDATHLPKRKNKFLFQNKELLKESEQIISKTSRFQRNLDETSSAEKSQNQEEIVKSPQKTLKANVKNSNLNEQSETAYDFVKKLRSARKNLDSEIVNGKFIQKTEQYDSKGFRILKNQVPDLKYYTRDEILDLLAKNILYSDDDLIVLNKPYNLVMHESKTVKDPCLSQYLDDLAAELDKKTYKPKLITVHRLDKETPGCLLLARNEISAQRLLSLFSQRKIVKTYWIVTIKVPDPLEGVIDIPISEGSVNGRARMVLHPDLPKDIPYQNHSKSGKRAVTHYKVIAESGNAALVEAKPETGIKHQIRVHFGFGLSCPILGDHKYSHLDKLAPQKLQSDLLQRLHVRQSKVRHIPMHIYARSIFIPQYRDGKNLFVMAPMPIHMSKNLQKLKFRKN